MALLANFLALLINVSISFVISLKSSLILNSCNNSSIVKYFNFKDKKYGWNNFALKISTDKKTFCCVGKQTYYFTGYYNFLYSRPSCSNCIFKGNTRASDITLSDCWGYANIAPEMTDNNGLSCIVCHSPKGKNLYNEIIKDVNWKKMSFDDLIKYNSNYNKIVDYYIKSGFFVS